MWQVTTLKRLPFRVQEKPCWRLCFCDSKERGRWWECRPSTGSPLFTEGWPPSRQNAVRSPGRWGRFACCLWWCRDSVFDVNVAQAQNVRLWNVNLRIQNFLFLLVCFSDKIVILAIYYQFKGQSLGGESWTNWTNKFHESFLDDICPCFHCPFPLFATVSTSGCKEVWGAQRSSWARLHLPLLFHPFPIMCLIRILLVVPRQFSSTSDPVCSFVYPVESFIQQILIQQLLSAECWTGHFICFQGSVIAALGQRLPLRSQWGSGLRVSGTLTTYSHTCEGSLGRWTFPLTVNQVYWVWVLSV